MLTEEVATANMEEVILPIKNEPSDWGHVKRLILQRYAVEGDCWEWKSYMTKGTTPILRHETTEGKTVVSPTRKLVALLWGRRICAGYKCIASCGNPRCINPDHILVVHEHAHLRRACKHSHETGNNALRSAKIASTRRERTTKLDWDKVQAIRASNKSYPALSREFGVSATVIGKVKRHEAWIDYDARNNPFSLLMR